MLAKVKTVCSLRFRGSTAEPIFTGEARALQKDTEFYIFISEFNPYRVAYTDKLVFSLRRSNYFSWFMVHRYGYGRNNVKELQRTSNMVARSSVDTVLFFFYNLQKKKYDKNNFLAIQILFIWFYDFYVKFISF